MADRIHSLVTPDSLRTFGYGNPNYRKNVDKARHNGHMLDETSCCCVCGKKALNATVFAMLSNGGEYITTEEATQFEQECAARGACSDDLGFRPVGSDCAKKLKKAGITLYPAP